MLFFDEVNSKGWPCAWPNLECPRQVRACVQTSGGVIVNREQTYSSALTNGFRQGAPLNAFVLALVDDGILGSGNCQNALSEGLPAGSPLSLFCGVSLEMSA